MVFALWGRPDPWFFTETDEPARFDRFELLGGSKSQPFSGLGLVAERFYEFGFHGERIVPL